MQKPISVLRILFALHLTGTLASSVDWPQWRGPNRDAVSTETGLLKDWPSQGPQLLWKTMGLGAGYSTVAVVGQSIYTIGEKNTSSFIVALNLADGKHVWTAKLGEAGAPGGFDGPRGMPTVDGDLIFAIGQFGDVVCVETATGKERWRKHLTKDFGGESPHWGFAESPLVDGNKVIFTPGGSQGAIVALDKNTGAKLWQSKEFTDPAHYSSLVATEIGGVRQYVQLTAASVAGVAAVDGKVLWKARRRGEVAVIPTPICDSNLVYVTAGYGVGCNLFKITGAGYEFSAEQIYANKVMVNHHGGVLKIGDYLYGYSDGKGWTCQNFKTGAAVWQEKGKLDKGSIVYADGRLYLRSEDNGSGTVALIEASPAGYKEHGRFNPPNRSDQNSWSHPVVANGKLFLRDQDVLLCYDVKGK